MMNKANIDYLAHIAPDGEIQTVEAHSANTSAISAERLKGINLEKTGMLAGLLHDLGKYTEEFNEYIKKSASGEPVTKGSVIHTFAGVYYILTKFHDGNKMEKLTAELIAFAIGAHHGNFDIIHNKTRNNGFTHRLKKQPEYEIKAIKNMESVLKENIQELFNKSVKEIEALFSRITEMVADSPKKEKEALFYLGCAARLIASAVMDGDRKDTASFMRGIDFDSLATGSFALWDKIHTNILNYIAGFNEDTQINKARKEISNACEHFASEKPGVYRLNVPTGGGKTLSALRYAVSHAKQFGKKRIIYTAPMISILDQNADVIREAVGDEQFVLEHHSNVVHPENTTIDELQQYELLSETWDSPIIATTLAQFLNTLFSGKTSSIRRMQSLSESVIIIDEIQQAPKNMLHLINLAVNFVSSVCKSTIIICSATQPILDEMDYKMKISEKEMIPKADFERYQKVFKRTKLNNAGKVKTNNLAELALNLSDGKSTLIICNTKAVARKTYQALKKSDNVFHLSAGMCPKHRRRVIAEIKDSLGQGQKVICVATQVVEAGVDLSFEVVIRVAAGMDNIIQAAGRCNRNGEKKNLSNVYIVYCEDESLGNLTEIEYAKTATLHLLSAFEENPKAFNYDLGSEEAIRFYYRKFNAVIRDQEGIGYFDKKVGTCTDNLLTLLSLGPDWQKGGEDYDDYFLHQAFKSAGDAFEVFDSTGRSVIVPYEERNSNKIDRIITNLNGDKAKYDGKYAKKLLTAAKDYTVNIYENQFQRLLEQGAIHLVLDGTVAVLDEGWYGEEGLLEEEDKEKCNTLIM